MKQEREELAKAEERNRQCRIRVAGEEVTIRRQIRGWLSLVGEDGIDSAVRTARKRRHPDETDGLDKERTEEEATRLLCDLVGMRLRKWRNP
jgi:hypothetical protein